MDKKLIDYEGFEAYSKGVKNKYAEKKDIPTSLSSLQEDTQHRLTTDDEKRAWNNKVDKIDGKQLSTNDYTNEAKTKVDNIPNNPKYTDTIPDLSGYATKAELSGKVDKVEGKGLSSNDFTNLERHKLHKLPDVEEFAEEWAKKANRTEIPKKISELENDKAFKTESEIQQMIEKASSLKKEVVTSLPTTGKDDVIYLVKDEKGKDNNNYLEYLWLNGKYELIGSTQVDLSGYATKSDLDKKQNVIKLGDGMYKNPDGQICAYQYNDGAIQDRILKLETYKLNNTDIQEFTQQELEEAFK